jgi:Peptidase inhibitor family I36
VCSSCAKPFDNPSTFLPQADSTLSANTIQPRQIGGTLMRRLFIACGAALAIATATVALSSPAYAAPAAPVAGPAAVPAHAAPPTGTPDTSEAAACPAHSLCLWRDANFRNTRWVFTLNQQCPYDTWCPVGSGANNQASSLYNARGYCTLLAKTWPIDVPHEQIVELAPGVAYNNLTRLAWPDGTSMNDSISAYALLSYC